jgi:VCBS repeat protein/ASPIC/UnbV protein
MATLLSAINTNESVIENPFCPQAMVKLTDSILQESADEHKRSVAIYFKAFALLQSGKEQESADLLERLLPTVTDSRFRLKVLKTLGITWLRLGERSNCIMGHADESCVFPIRGNGIQANRTGSEKAIKIYQTLLTLDTADLESRWLLNIAYMTLGDYPSLVPRNWLLKGLDTDSALKIKPFAEMAVSTGLDINNQAGGSIVEDFDNDGNLDIVTSSWDLKEGMHYCRNNGNGTFTDLSARSGLKDLTGGLNIMQTDYNNDGLKDIFVLRGAWREKYGREPVSLLRNNGDGTFTDVTKESGLLSLHPTQTATWADFNNDGWLDVFVGPESTKGNIFPCELFINNRDGTFTEVAAKAGCDIKDFVKGVIAGDFNNDGRPDIFISSLSGEKRLFRNDGVINGCVHFTDVADQAGLKINKEPTFATWFWDYDNDGWSDILICNYDQNRSLAVYAAAEALHKRTGKEGEILLFHNNHDGTFTNVTDEVGLNKVVFAMGCNFGDIDNDGFPDMYFGTGNPLYQSLVPNKLFKNIAGRKFADVTGSGRVGNLQKGHGVSFADIDNDGDEDIYIDMGGAYPGDAYPNLLYVNPGQNTNHWLSVQLEGTTSNRAAIGARIKLSFKENGKERAVYKDVNSGGSFGANPLRQHIGTGTARIIDSMEIKWPGSGKIQVFTNVQTDEFIRITEGSDQVTRLPVQPFFLMGKNPLDCAPKH